MATAESVFNNRFVRPLLAAAAAAAGAAALVGLGVGSASAHTESDYLAVPAGEEVTVNFRPTHGCEGSPTTAVAVRAPVAGATAGEVDGFTATAEPDGDQTVLRWAGGLLPADEEGEFPVTFTVPDTVGQLLLFPAVQTCEVGELFWIDGDPEGEYPAVRLLVLAAGSEPAQNIDEVPADAAGRELLTAIADVDNPGDVGATTTVPATTEAPATSAAPTTTTAATTTAAADATTTVPSTTAASATTTPLATTAAPSTTEAEDDDDGVNPAVIIIPIVVVVLAAIGGVILVRSRR